MYENNAEHESLVRQLNDDALRREYARPFDAYRPGIVPSFLGWLLVSLGNLVYGVLPSYAKFRAVEVIARIPYQSWESAAYTLLTAFYSNERRAVSLCKLSAFGRFAQDNETMHVVVISQLARKQPGVGFFRHALVPLLFSLFYFWAIYILYLLSRRAALELNYLFEKHAYEQYSEFLEKNAELLRHKPVMSEFLQFYGREVRNEYEFFESVRNDELIHRNRSIRELQAAIG
jgi:ubiquinol oxidase